MPIIEFKNFSFKYANLKEPTLKNINLKIEKGEKVLIAGASGSGKSTLMHCINGIVPFAYSGNISGELSVAELTPYEEDIFEISKKAGTILQDQDSQFIGLTVGEDVAFIQENNNIEISEIQKKVVASLKMVQMEDFLNHSPYELSGGQKQCVSLAGLLSSETEILLFDEPLANLDPASGKKVIELIDELQKKYNKTIIIIEHRIEDVIEKNIDRLVVIDKGEIKANDKPDIILKKDILRKYGLREPLYIEALKHYDIDIQKIKNLHNISSCNSPEIGIKINADILQKTDSNTVKKEAVKDTLLNLKNVDFAYNQKEGLILKNINFSLYKGEIISILGNNGAGKSTLSNIITGILKPNRGKVSLEDTDITSWSIKNIGTKIGYVMQNPNHMIVKHMIKDEVSLGLEAAGLKRDFIEDKYKETISTCGLYGYRNWPVGSLSYGQKKRVTIASILALDPKLVILDEPTAGQDYKTYTTFMDFVQKIADTGISVILITHDMHLALEYTSRSIVLSGGKIIADDIPSKVLSDKKIVEKASLKETSLGSLADVLKLEQKDAFIQSFIGLEKGLRKVE
jgi:energy-coupling factor transport system ATP-binding protein